MSPEESILEFRKDAVHVFTLMQQPMPSFE